MNVLREASPLALPSESFTSGGVAAFRRKPKEANLFPSFGFLPKEGRPSLPSGSFTSGASFGKLHLWRLPEGRVSFGKTQLPWNTSVPRGGRRGTV